jgi:hypothetical protein
MNETSGCADPACNCFPADGSKYCSVPCAEAKGIAELACQHSACQDESLKP